MLVIYGLLTNWINCGLKKFPGRKESHGMYNISSCNTEHVILMCVLTQHTALSSNRGKVILIFEDISSVMIDHNSHITSDIYIGYFCYQKDETVVL